MAAGMLQSATVSRMCTPADCRDSSVRAGAAPEVAAYGEDDDSPEGQRHAVCDLDRRAVAPEWVESVHDLDRVRDAVDRHAGAAHDEQHAGQVEQHVGPVPD